jgi:hypothetical protein
MNIGRKLRNAWQEMQEPWIIFRPSQAVRRIMQQSRSKLLEEEKHSTAWGASIWCNPHKAIGENIRFRKLALSGTFSTVSLIFAPAGG